MPLKIIGAGFGRTGTTSVYEALNRLGFPCYHMVEVFKNKGHIDFWYKVAGTPPGAQNDWAQVLGKYTAAVDAPTCCVWRELLAANPDAKVLLTLHPKGAEAWYQSVIETIYRIDSMWQYRFLGFIAPPFRRFREMLRGLVWERTHKGTLSDRAKAIADYDAHIADVKTSVPADQLLVFSADQGWEPLCKFLGVPVPTTPFPRANDRAAMKRRMQGAAVLPFIIIGFAVMAVAAIAYAL